MNPQLRELIALAKVRRCADHPRNGLYPSGEPPHLTCSACGGEPTSYTEVESASKQYRRGRPLPAALQSNMDRKYGMTEEQTQAVAVVRATPPSILPTGDEALKLVKQFHGWTETKEGKPLPIKMSTAVAIHGLVNMGILPAHINVLGGNPYVTVDGMIAHGQRVIEQRGQEWGRVVYTSVLDKDELKRLGNPGDGSGNEPATA